MKLYAPPGLWLNDPKVVYLNCAYHLFHIQGRRTVPWNPEEKTYGHAVSKNLVEWQRLRSALERGRSGAWDDFAIWTMDVCERDGTFYMLYTGLSRKEGGRMQRIGLATSKDLVHWEKHPANPVLTADPRYYESDYRNAPGYGHVAWRDPAIYADPQSGWTYTFITARTNKGLGKTRGCVGLARSRDLVHWEILPPAYAPQRFVYHEVPQVVKVGARFVMLFSAKSPEHRNVRYTYHLTSDHPLRWDHTANPRPLIGGPDGLEYSGCLVNTGARCDLVHLCYEWLARHPDRPRVRGRISLPKRFTLDREDKGRLAIWDEFRPIHKVDLASLAIPSGWRIADGAVTRCTAGGSGLVRLGRTDDVSISARIDTTGCGRAGIAIGLDAHIGSGMRFVVSRPANLVEVLRAGTGDVLRSWAIERRRTSAPHLCLVLLGKHTEVYLDGEYLGSMCFVEARARYLALCAEDVEARFSELKKSPIQYQHAYGVFGRNEGIDKSGSPAGLSRRTDA
jgi:beta-fructofuranosidase